MWNRGELEAAANEYRRDTPGMVWLHPDTWPTADAAANEQRFYRTVGAVIFGAPGEYVIHVPATLRPARVLRHIKRYGSNIAWRLADFETDRADAMNARVRTNQEGQPPVNCFLKPVPGLDADDLVTVTELKAACSTFRFKQRGRSLLLLPSKARLFFSPDQVGNLEEFGRDNAERSHVTPHRAAFMLLTGAQIVARDEAEAIDVENGSIYYDGYRREMSSEELNPKPYGRGPKPKGKLQRDVLAAVKALCPTGVERVEVAEVVERLMDGFIPDGDTDRARTKSRANRRGSVRDALGGLAKSKSFTCTMRAKPSQCLEVA